MSTFNFATAGTGADPLFGTEAYSGDNSESGTTASDLLGLNDGGFFNSIFDTNIQPVDPTNSGNTGSLQDISTPSIAGENNPETAGGSSLGAVLNNAINAGFSAWQLASLPKNVPKTVQTQVGQTRVVAGTPTLANSIFGPTTQSGSSLLVIGILIIVGLLIYKSVAK